MKAIRKLFGLSIFLLAIILTGCTTSVSFTINFDSNGGTDVAAIVTDGSSTITIPGDPTKEGFFFGGWYWDNNTFSQPFTANSLLDSPLSSNMTVYAKWNEDDNYIPPGSVQVTFDSNGGTVIDPVHVLIGHTIAIPVVTKNGYTLDGWYTSVNGGVTLDERWSFTTSQVTNAITLYAKWNINTYTITYHLNNGINSISNPSTFTYESDTILLENPTKDGYTFIGWYQQEDLTGDLVAEIATNSYGDNNLYAKWEINQYTINFESNGGSSIDSITQDYNTIVTEPSEPTREGYTFARWYTSGAFSTVFTFNTMSASNMTAYAKWNAKSYTITFETNGGSAVTAKTQNYATNVTAPTNPAKTGYTFDGWYSDSAFVNAFTFSTMLAENITLYAKWIINQYFISYYLVNETVTQIEAGLYHSLAITSTGRVFAWGNNEYGQLGDGTTTQKSTPMNITSLFGLATGETVTQIVAGSNHSFALTSTGRVFAWGHNEYGQLGDGTSANKSTPTETTTSFGLASGETVTQIVAGFYHSLAITLNGRVFAWGYNNNGQLGDGTIASKYTPTNITAGFGLSVGETVTQIVAGAWHSLAITSNGRVFAWGGNGLGQLGDGETSFYKSTPMNITSRFGLATGETVTQIVAGLGHSFVITSNGRVFAWGYNSEGQLGNGTTTSKSTPTEITARFGLSAGETVTQIVAGDYYSLSITSTGRVFAWGNNEYGQLGDGTTVNKSILTDITFAREIELLQTSQYDYSTSIVEFVPTREGYSFGGWYIDILLTNPCTYTSMPSQNITLYGKWTANSYTITFETNGGSVVTSKTQNYATNVTAPTNPAKTGYTFDGWYSDSTFENAYTFTTIPAENITVYVKWEINQYDVTYYYMPEDFDPMTDVSLMPGETITQIVAGSNHSLSITSTGRVFAWGGNGLGQLGDGTTTNKTIPVEITENFNLSTGEKITSIFLGGWHSSALTSTGRVFAWGSNYYGQLGDGTSTNRNTPIDITSSFNLNEDEIITDLFLGRYQSSALTANGRLFTWGLNDLKQILHYEIGNIDTPREILNRFSLSDNERIISISFGGSHSSAITSTGRIFTWGGYNFSGQLGHSVIGGVYGSSMREITSGFNLDDNEIITQVSLGDDHSSAITSNGRVFAWGNNSNGQLGDGTTSNKFAPTEITACFGLATGETVTQIVAEGHHSLAITSTGRVFAWGYNIYGQLGDGTTTDKSTPTNITSRFGLATGETVTQIIAGTNHSLVITSTGRVFAWGYNYYGQLGDGTTISKATPTNITFIPLILFQSDTYYFGATIIELVPTCSGYTFGGWYTDNSFSQLYVFTTIPAQNIMLYGKGIPN